MERRRELRIDRPTDPPEPVRAGSTGATAVPGLADPSASQGAWVVVPRHGSILPGEAVPVPDDVEILVRR